jgi:hypothetical protein
MASTKPNSNKNTLTSQSTQNLWCRDTYWQHITNVLGYSPFKETNGCRLRKCQFEPGSCRGAHCATDLKPLGHISSYNRLNKSKYNWVGLYNGLVSSLQADAPKLILEEHKRKIADVPTQNFVEVIQLWRELACYYRKIAKEIPFKRSSGNSSTLHSSGYRYSDDVPGFYLDGSLEDTAWAFERLTRYCGTHKAMEANIARKQQITVWDLCLATGLNCKEGVHYTDEHICESNFLTGTCTCPTKESIEAKEAELQIRKIELTRQLTKMIEEEAENDDEGWSTGGGKKKSKGKQTDPKQELRNQIASVDDEIAAVIGTQRMIHYTELGMIPFAEQLANYRAEEEAKKLAHPVEEQVKPKESWDHGIESVSAVPKAIKVTKLGGKKK